MRELVFASANQHKVEEVSKKLDGYPLKGLKDIGCWEEIPETADTIEGNAAMKARYVFEKFGVDCFADDTGLLVDALNGAPGVQSAYYAGPQKDASMNRALLLQTMGSELHRGAHFKTVICLIIAGKEYFFEGIVNGHIAREERGVGGFGYDSIFVPSGNSRTFAMMSVEEKNILSHRGLALKQLLAFLKSNS